MLGEVLLIGRQDTLLDLPHLIEVPIIREGLHSLRHATDIVVVLQQVGVVLFECCRQVEIVTVILRLLQCKLAWDTAERDFLFPAFCGRIAYHEGGVRGMEKDPFEEYLRMEEPGRKELGYAWQTGVGLQAVDQLTPSKYLLDTARDNIEGRITLERANELIESYYRESPLSLPDRTEEADKVAVRIAQILAEKTFVFSPAQYLAIHRRLFHGIYSHAGTIRDYNITKKEWVLDGGTVLYGGALDLQPTLEYDFEQEKQFSYKGLDLSEIIRHLARFISRLWQIHVFGEGNTRATAVFFIKYLRTLGFDVTNDTFAEHAWYFRNAMVRANYSNLKRGIHETTEYLELFLRNLLLGEKNELRNRYLHISRAFQKQDMETSNQDIDERKQDIETPFPYLDILRSLGLREKTIAYTKTLFAAHGYNIVFGRGDTMDLLGLTPSPASELLRKLLSANVICPVKGMGKGRYRFVSPKP